MPAAKGFRPPNAGRGRELGSKNKLSGQVKEMILAALDQVGGVDYLPKSARMYLGECGSDLCDLL
jgi:hypothetical protein